jgi:hypothetical protein
VYDCISYDIPPQDRQKASEILEILDSYLEYKPEIPKGLSFEEQAVYHQLIKVLGKDTPGAKLDVSTLNVS